MKKLIAFDLDGTLAPSKSPMDPRMADLFGQLLKHYQVGVISGGKFEQFEKQMLNCLSIDEKKLSKLHLLPTCGTRYYRRNKGAWVKVYAEDLTKKDKEKIISALNKGFDDLGYRAYKTYGDAVEDRGSQVTYSVLGQDIVDVLGDEGVKIKYEWDPDDSKKRAVRDYVAPLIPEFEVRVGGVTSIDVTRPGIDKAYGMRKLLDSLSIIKKDVLFFGDRLQEGGNDYPVKAMGIDCIEVSSWEETAVAVEAIIINT